MAGEITIPMYYVILIGALLQRLTSRFPSVYGAIHAVVLYAAEQLQGRMLGPMVHIPVNYLSNTLTIPSQAPWTEQHIAAICNVLLQEEAFGDAMGLLQGCVFCMASMYACMGIVRGLPVAKPSLQRVHPQSP